ncbi:EF-hand domain-containing protein [Streptomyces fradiae]|uniref:EF-hand domain-containing protein n=1 Tax=Streptomyces fradiae TaxID=1906 RepID=UPI00351375E9
MTTDVITTKLEREFDSKDANGDGYLDWSDYQSLADRYIAAYKLDKNEYRARALVASQQMNWMELLRHSGVQGDRLTKDEFVTASRLAAVDTSRLNVVEGSAHAIFDVVDVNGDNEISRDEFARLLKDVWKTDSPDAMEAFHRLDTDGDGSISRQEFIRATREHFYSNDPDAPGSLFYGRV